jgi:predicted negative regulator of RcsB-dependent stress response
VWRAVGILLLLSAGLFAALTVWTNHTTAAAHAESRAFAQRAKTICEHAPHTKAGVLRAADQLARLAEPPNVHRAVARLELHWHRLAVEPSALELKQARLAAHLLNVKACMRVAPS